MKPDLTSDKTELLAACIAKQQENVQVAREAMYTMQQTALSERSNEEMTDAFSAQCQNEQAMYAKRMHEASGLLSVLERARSIRPSPRIGFGSLVVTDRGKFFVAAGIGQFDYKGEKYLIISSQSPIFQAMEGKGAGETFDFRDTLYTIERVS